MKLAVGIFVISLVLVISTFLFLVLKEKGTFDKRFTYYFNTQSANSFNVGMPLKFSGFNIGIIDNIALRNDGTVHMSFSVTEENRKWINKSSRLTIKKPLIGSPHIEVFSGLNHEPLPAGATLEIVISDDINDMISKLEPAVERVIHIIENIDKITSSLARDDSDLMQTMQSVNKFTKKLANDKSLLTSITGDKESTQALIASLKQSDAIMRDIKAIAQNIKELTGTLDQKIIDPSSLTIKELNIILKDVKQKLDALDSTVKSIGTFDTELIEMKEQISVGIQKSNQIMDKVDALMQDESKAEVELP